NGSDSRRRPFTRALSSRQKAFVLVAFAPFLAELVSGSTPPQAWILPQVVLIFMAIYGLSALAIREFALRIKGGPATVFILGLAFGIVTEGMAAHSLFNPGWPDAGVLGSYGRWEGVNWLWTEWIVPFHAVWSISFPIFLTGRFWPDSRSVRFLSDRWLVGLAPVPVVVAVVTGQVFADTRSRGPIGWEWDSPSWSSSSSPGAGSTDQSVASTGKVEPARMDGRRGRRGVLHRGADRDLADPQARCVPRGRGGPVSGPLSRRRPR